MNPKRSHPLFFSSDNISDEAKAERLIQLMAAFKETGSKSLGSSTPMTYAKAFNLLRLADPELFDDIGKFFQRKRPVPKLVKLYKQLANLKPEKTAIQRIREDLDVMSEAMTKDQSTKGSDSEEIQRHYSELREALYFLEHEESKGEKLENKANTVGKEKKTMWENEAIERDFYTAQRDQYSGLSPIKRDGFREYSLPNERLMRIRLLHNRAPEKLTGVDLLYEQVDVEHQKIRFVNLQYKMWDDRTFGINKEKELRQMERMQSKFCNEDFCKYSGKKESEYRLPFCTAFYRPTNRRQSKNAQLMTTGIHLPVCFISKFSPISISKNEVYSHGLSHSTFDELFRNGLIGSAWIDIKKIEKHYKESKIIDENESILLNVRNEIGHTKSRLSEIPRLNSLI